MIDLHTHILPGVDDGAVDLEVSLSMGRYGAEGGLNVVAATPHFYQIPDWNLVKKKVAELQQEFDQAEIPLKLVPGAELMIDLDLLELDTMEIPTYGDGGKFCLIELPLQHKNNFLCTPRKLFLTCKRGGLPLLLLTLSGMLQ